MPYGSTDLRVLARDTGVLVTFNGVSAYSDTGEPIRGLLDLPMSIGLRESGIGGVENDAPELRLPYNCFSPLPADGDTITVTDPWSNQSTVYQVTQPTAEDDGAILCYLLRATS